MRTDIKKFQIRSDIPVTIALKKLSEVGERILFVIDSAGRLIGSLTDGDIRRWVLKEGGLAMSSSIEHMFNKEPFCLDEDYDIAEAKEVMLTNKIEQLPVLGNKRQIVDILFWENIFSQNIKKGVSKIDMPVV